MKPPGVAFETSGSYSTLVSDLHRAASRLKSFSRVLARKLAAHPDAENRAIRLRLTETIRAEDGSRHPRRGHVL
ncbi:hypothetical protein EQ718_10085 [Paracoccus versutus]|uniref:Uncharacterized protein n=1 Tax=Paracoccus versutus TaxID=34007 RepID=A0AAQ0HHF1_PARVE|nr:hypothetical protein [Paracoccus versutus]KGJ07368.1 hypothetical protein IT40_21025 [Paracoccus versutus]REG46979.1 hypothetical protein ATH84_1013108 [Paracoccus versutus]WEJ79196.1 hypothetical protein EQ718_10085 [Paracoccus versutus]